MFSDTNKLFCNTTPINRLKAAKAMKELYQYCNSHSYASDCWKGYTTARPSREPEIIFADGPDEVVDLFNVDDTELVDLERFNDITHFVTKRGYGSKERVSSVVSQVFSRLLPYKRTPRCWTTPLLMPVDYLYNNKHHSSSYVNQWEDLATKVWDEIYVAFTYQDRCYIIDRPSLVKTNDRGLHCKDGPAMVFRDGSEVYCYEGIKVSEGAIKHPELLTLKDIHKYKNSSKHILIDLCGVDRYQEMCKAWKPDVKGKFAKFFSMAEMVPVPGSWDLRSYGKDWDGYANLYKERPAYVDFTHRDVNGQSTLSLEDNYHNIYAFERHKHPFDHEFSAAIFNKQDRELWDLLDVEEMSHRGAFMGIRVAFQNGVFSLKNAKTYEGHRSCNHDIAPSWFKAKMFRNQNALYINEELDYAIQYEDGKLSYAGNIEQGGSCIPANEPKKPIIARNSLFSGCENIPSYRFDIDLSSDSWEGLLEKWARLSFEWIGMCENSTCLP